MTDQTTTDPPNPPPLPQRPHPAGRETFGHEVGPSRYGPRHVIAEPQLSPAGNLMFPIGVMVPVGMSGEGDGWEQTGHITMTQSEARTFFAKCVVVLDGFDPLYGARVAAAAEGHYPAGKPECACGETAQDWATLFDHIIAKGL